MKVLKINSLEKGFCDSDYLLLHAAFQILVDFVEKEEPEQVIDWSYNSKHWYKTERIHQGLRWQTIPEFKHNRGLQQIAGYLEYQKIGA